MSLPMKILIFGIVASGKTTLAKRLSNKLNIPCYEGDCIAWGFPGQERYKRSDERQLQTIMDIDKNPSWIVEGTYRQSQLVLYELADKIIFLDTPLYIRYYRIVTRYIKQKLGLEKSNYKPNMAMLMHMFKWTAAFEKERKLHEQRLMNYQNKLIWVKSADELIKNIHNYFPEVQP